MKTSQQRLRFSHTVIALAVLSALGQAQAQEAPLPSSVSVGGAYVSGDSADRARFGLFNGMRDNSGYGLLDFLYLNRDSATGLWTSFEGRNLFLDTREVNFTTRKLGDWKVSADYSEILRTSPYTINSSAQGLGSTTPVYSRLATPGTGEDTVLDTHRKAITLAGSKWFGGALQFEASFKSEDKDGARSFGKGFACSGTWVSAGSCATSSTQWALLFMPEPVDSTINQAEARLTYAKNNLLITAGYYGNIYINRNGNVTPSLTGATINNPLGAAAALDSGLRTTMNLPLALNPDSQAHQFFVSGNYRFTPTTVANFKYAYTKATQDDDFGAAGFFQAPSGRTNAGAEMDTTLAQASISARPMPKLSLLASIRYENKEDKTPVDLYNIEGGPTTTFTNSPADKKRVTSKLEGSYLLPGDYRATLGFDWETADHGEFTPTSSVAGLSGIRQKTKEQGYRLELRRSLSETLTGFVSYTYSKREGDSPWLKPLSLSQGRGVIEANDDPACVPPAAPAINNCIYSRTGIFPFIFEDRKRDKVKVMATWVPSDQLSLQFFVEDGKDKFDGNPTEHGLRETSMKLYSADAAYRVSEDVSLTAYISSGRQQGLSGHSTGYDGDVKDRSTAFGVGIQGKASDKLQLAANLTYVNEDLTYKQEMDQNASAANIAFLATYGGLPDVRYNLLRFTLSGDYALNRQSSIRGVIGYERSKFNEWTWQWNGYSFLFSDNTTISAQENQSVTYVGASYTYRFK